MGKYASGTHSFPPDLLARRERRKRSTYLCCGKSLLLGCRGLNARVCVCLCLCVVAECVLTQRLPAFSPSEAGWPVEGGERGTLAATTSPALAATQAPHARF